MKQHKKLSPVESSRRNHNMKERIFIKLATKGHNTLPLRLYDAEKSTLTFLAASLSALQTSHEHPILECGVNLSPVVGKES